MTEKNVNQNGSPVAADAPDRAAVTGRAPEQLVPGWLALLVLILMLAVVGLGGWVVRGLLIDEDAVSPQEVAVADWKAKVSQDPASADTRLGLAFAYQQQGDWQQALEEYDTVLESDPANTAALYNKGIVLMQLGENKAAEETLWDVLEIAPDHALAAKGLGEYYVAKQQYQSALVAVEPVVEARPEFADLQFIAGYSYEQLGQVAQAVERYEAALRYAPDLVEARDGLKRLGEGG